MARSGGTKGAGGTRGDPVPEPAISRRAAGRQVRRPQPDDQAERRAARSRGRSSPRCATPGGGGWAERRRGAPPPPAARSPVVFAHGFAVTPAIYSSLLQSWARAGFVVAAPLFPLSSAGAPGGPDENDVLNQPADMSFVITSLLAESACGRRGRPARRTDRPAPHRGRGPFRRGGDRPRGRLQPPYGDPRVRRAS